MPDPISSAGSVGARTRLDRLQLLRDGAGVQVPVLRPGASQEARGASFGDTLKGFVNDVSAQQDAAGELRDKFLRGEQVELHQVMAAGEEAGISLELMITLRDKVLDAYRQLTTMQS
jgi:flagellar hook-basal body complex protein FliE